MKRPSALRASKFRPSFETLETRCVLYSGDLDTAFGGGIVRTEIDDATASANSAYEAVRQTDGKLVATGDGGVARYLADGSLDATFGVGGRQSLPFNARSIVQQPDGKFIIAGNKVKIGGSDIAVTRLLPGGSIDPSFGTSGVTISDIGGLDQVAKAILQPDGKILIVGSSDSSLVVARYLPNGQLDSAFDSDGLLVRRFFTMEAGYDAVVASSGTITVLARTTNASFKRDLMVLRFTSSGTLDTSFDSDGWTTIDIAADDTPTSLSLLSSGAVLVGANAAANPTNKSVLVKLNANGSLDTTFDSDGIRTDALFNSSAVATDATLLPNGQILVVGGTSAELFAIRYNANGTIDSNWDGDGFVRVDGFVSPKSVLVASDGSLYVSGTLFGKLFGVGKLKADGTRATDFSLDGRVSTDFGPTIDRAIDLVTLPDGKLLALANSNDHVAVLRYLANGQLDTSFSGDGKFVFDFGVNYDVSQGAAIRRQADGKIVVGGTAFRYASANAIADMAIARLNADGTLDTTFSSDGLATYPMDATYLQLADIAIQPDGRTVIAGGNGQSLVLARVLANGALDTSFDGDGIRNTILPVSVVEVNALALLPDNKLLLSGSVSNGLTRGLYLTRYLPNGQPDTTFDGDGIFYDPTNSLRVVRGMFVQPDGRIVIGGGTEVFDPNYNVYRSQFAIARFLANGQRDTSFGYAGIVSDSLALPGIASGIDVRVDGRIVAAGFSDFDPTIIQLNSDGTLDSSFGGDGKVTTNIINPQTELVAKVRLQQDGKPVVFGAFVSGDFDLYLTRYRNDAEGAVSTLVSTNSTGAIEVSDRWNRDDALEFLRQGTSLLITDKTLDSRARLTIAGIAGAQAITPKQISIPLAAIEATGKPLQVMFAGGDDRLELNMFGSASLIPSQGIDVWMSTGTDSLLMTNSVSSNSWYMDNKNVSGYIGALGVVRALDVEKLAGGNGNDLFVAGGTSSSVISTIDGSLGADTFRIVRDTNFLTSENQLPSGVFDLKIQSNPEQNFRLTSIETLDITGGAGPNVIDGRGFRGTALFHGGAGNDILYGGRGNDLLYGDDGHDIVQGFDGDDVIVGGAGNDILMGEFGADRLDGGLGEDIVTGGYFSTFNSFNINMVGRDALAAIWFGTGSYAQKIDLMRNVGVTVNNQLHKLSAGFGAFSDNQIDSIWGGADLDWFFAKTSGPDSEIGLPTLGVRDRNSSEALEAMSF